MSIKCKTNFGSVLYFNKKETFEKYVLFTAEFTQMCFDLNDDERYKRFQFNFTVSAASHPSWTKWCIISCTDMCLGSSHIIESLMLHHHPCAISILAVTSSSISSPPKFVFFSSLSSLCPLCPLAHLSPSGACYHIFQFLQRQEEISRTAGYNVSAMKFGKTGESWKGSVGWP